MASKPLCLLLIFALCLNFVTPARCNCKMVANSWKDPNFGVDFEVNNCVGSCTRACRASKWKKRREISGKLKKERKQLKFCKNNLYRFFELLLVSIFDSKSY